MIWNLLAHFVENASSHCTRNKTTCCAFISCAFTPCTRNEDRMCCFLRAYLHRCLWKFFHMLHTLFMFSLSFKSQSHENTENYEDENNSVAMILSCVRRNSSVPVLHASQSQRFCCDVIQSFLLCARLGLYSLCSCSRSCYSSSFFSVMWQDTMVSAGLVKCLECAGFKEPSRKGLPRHTVLSS